MSIDKKNLEYHYNNFIYPKPVENIDEEIIKTGKVPYADPNFSWHILWPEKNHLSKKLNVLIAGCGSDQAAILAKCNPDHFFTGVDLSKKSIDHNNYLLKKHNIKNLKLICEDFREIQFNQKFDYIISTGVIHHLVDPSSGLKYFNENLKPNGVINLMVYGDKDSKSLNHFKRVFKELQLSQNTESIKIAKNVISNLNHKHPTKVFTDNLDDMKYDSGIIDLLLHKQEKFYSISELIELLDKNNLIIKNFYDGKIPSFSKFFLNDFESIKKIRQLPIKKKLDLGQILNWDDRKIELVVCKKKDQMNSLVYNKLSYMDLYLYHNRGLKYKINQNSIQIEEISTSRIYTYNIPNNISIDWKRVFSGKYKLSQILKDVKPDNLNNILSFFEIIIENYHLDKSYKQIGNYLNFFGK